MDNTIAKMWNDMALHWDDWSSPLRPCAEDLRIMREALVGWHSAHPLAKVRVFMCGITPEIATMDWPFPIDLVGMDQAESMVRIVWPGDIPGVRRGLVGNWTRPGLPPHSSDAILGDGGFAFFDFPDGQRTLMNAMRELISPGGLFVYRHYAQADRRETTAEVLDDMRAGRIGSFHVFRWRIAMAIQPDASAGVRQHDIWQAVMDARTDPAKVPQPGWSARAMDTIRHSLDKQSRYYFPTLDEFRSLLAESFTDIQVQFPDYELGHRCPILTARPR